MFQIPEAMHSYWEEQARPKATAADIARIERLFGTALPAPYVEFISSYGFVVFDDVPGMRCLFDFVVKSPEGEWTDEGDIAFFHKPERMLMAYENLAEPRPEDPECFPKFPAHFLPIANDAGQGQILLEFGEHPGRVWYWRENEWAWGVEDNTWLGFVADDFESFINKLRA